MRIKTDQLFTLGMALTTDKKAMERRVRGVFARRRSTRGALILSLVLALALGIGAFTTACQPGRVIASDGNALASGGDALASGGNALASGGNALASGGNALASAGNALVSGGNATQYNQTFTKELAMKQLSQTLRTARRMIVPHIEDVVFNMRGEWERQKSFNDSERLVAAQRFLETANAIFSTNYMPDDLDAFYYVDQTGNRPDIWRFDSKEGVLAGAVDAETLAFLSADCINEPSDQLHESLLSGRSDGSKVDPRDLDMSALTSRIAKLFGGMVENLDSRGGYSVDGATAGWMIKKGVIFWLGDGRYCAINAYADQNLTPTTVCIYPDEDCAIENVFWRADLEQAGNVSKLLCPQDFREGDPGAGDMTREKAIAFYDKLLKAAGYTGSSSDQQTQEPTATFFLDHSGARENYWHIEGGGVSFDLTSKTSRMLNLKANALLGSKLGLGDIPYEKMGEKEYEDATRKLLIALFGKDAITSVSVNAVYDGHYCTMDPQMADGTAYEIMFQDGLIVEATSYVYTNPNAWNEIPSWLADWSGTDPETGRAFIKGFDGSTTIGSNWLADWVYVNNKTGEIFLKEG